MRGQAYRAGAGTGKTHRLVERYVELLAAGLKPLEIVAVTFTERAALEFKSRVRERLRELPNPEGLLAELEAAPIGTIHSLAARICREFPEEAGVPADFQVLDDLEAALLRAEWVEEALLEALEEGGYGALVEAVGYEGLLDTLERALEDPLAAEELLKEEPARLDARLRSLVRSRFAPFTTREPDQRLGEVWPLLRRLFGAVRTKVEERLRRARRLGYADLEVHALRALECEAVRAYYQDRFRHLLVDEFQDTNPVQARLLRALFPDLDAWTVAGDPNQSIYAFRRADPKVFLGLLEEMGGRVQVLEESHRYHQGLACFHNSFFGELLGEGYLPVQASRDPLNPGPAVLHAACEAEEAFRLIAREVRRLRAGGFRVREGAGERPLEYRDVAVIAPTWRLLARAAQALHREGVPAVEAKGGNLLETREFEDAFLALRFLADTGDEEALLGLLRAPFFALPDPELRGLAEERKGTLWEAAPKEVREVLEDLLRRKGWEPPSQLLQRLDMATGYTGVLSALPRGPRRVKDWEGVLELVRQLERGDEDPFLVVRKLRLLRREGVEVPRPPLEAGNAVTLITAHSAKGLEWPVVFLLQVGDWKGRSPWKTRALFRPGLALLPPVLDGEGEAGHLFHLAKACLEEEDEAERRRLLYVAATRAAERLYLVLTPRALEGWREALKRAKAKAWEEVGMPEGESAPQGGNLGSGRLELKPLPSLPLESLPVSLLALAAKDLEAARRRLWGGPPDGELPEPWKGEDEEGVGGALVGTLVHALLERFDDLEALEGEGQAFLEAAYPDAEVKEREEALALARAFLSQEAFAPYRGGEKEVPVVCYLELGEGATVALEGRADRVGEDWVLDYKTDRAVDLEAYRLQVGLYALALGKAKALVADLRQGRVEEVCLEGLMEKVAGLVQELRRPPQDPSP